MNADAMRDAAKRLPIDDGRRAQVLGMLNEADRLEQRAQALRQQARRTLRDDRDDSTRLSSGVVR